MHKTRLLPALTLSIAAVAAGAIFATAGTEAAGPPQYRVLPINDVPFGRTGAVRYETLLTQMAQDGWSYDHSIPGFVVFSK